MFKIQLSNIQNHVSVSVRKRDFGKISSKYRYNATKLDEIQPNFVNRNEGDTKIYILLRILKREKK